MNTFELYHHPVRDRVAVKRGFSWPAFFLTGVWAAAKQLWLAALLLLSVLGGLLWLSSGLTQDRGFFIAVFFLLLGVIAGMAGNGWRVRKMQRQGYEYLGAFEARSPAEAVQRLAVVGGVIPEDWKTQRAATALLPMPRSVQQLVALAWLTCKAAWRFRLFPLLAAVLLITVIGLPLIIRDDGTARGLIQIMITYTLGLIITMLGLCTLWLSCGTLARDVEECQMQVVAVKPVPRWQIWMGKWVGIMTLNAALLALAGLAVFFLVQWRASKLPAEQQLILRSELLVARASAREPVPDFEGAVRAELAARQKKMNIDGVDLMAVQKQLREEARTAYQVVRPGYVRRWIVNVGASPERLRGQPMHIRIKFASSQITGSPQPYLTTWIIGAPSLPRRQFIEKMLTNDTFHELTVAPDLVNEKGELTIDFVNRNLMVLLFSPEEGMEVLYREGSFGMNFCRALMILFIWLGVLAALGLASASYLSFPVAAFLALSLLVAGLSSGTIATVVKDGNLMGNSLSVPSLLDTIAVPVLKRLLDLVNLVLDFSPIDALSTGRSVTWGIVGQALMQIWLLVGGILAAVGIFIFTRRELATAQGGQ